MAEVRRIRFLWQQQETLKREQKRINDAIDQNIADLLDSGQQLAQARASSRIATQIITYAPTVERMATAEAMADDDPLPTRPRTARIP